MRHFTTILMVLAFTMAVCALPALGDQLTLGGDGSATFTGLSTGFQVTIDPNGCSANPPFSDTNCIGSTSTGSFESPTGHQVFGGANWAFSIPAIAPFLTTGALDGSGNYPVVSGNPSTFNFSGNGANSGDSVTGTINWTAIDPANVAGHNLAVFVGALTISASTGVLTTDYPAGHATTVDYTFDLGSTNSLASVAGHSGVSLAGQASSGEVPGVPEVSSILLLGTGLLSAGTFVRLRRRRQS